MADVIIAADGGALRLPDTIVPDIICGDFDSSDIDALRLRFPKAEIVVRECQESNDLEKSVRLAMDRGISEVDIVCASGGLLDQTLTTISLLERYHAQVSVALRHAVFSEGDSAVMFMTCRVLSHRSSGAQECSVSSKPGGRVSLIPLGGRAVVSLSKVRWMLNGEALTPGSRGVSNEALGDSIAVTVHDGMIVLCTQE